MLPSYMALPDHLAPGLLVFFMIALAVLPLAIIWLDERRNDGAASRLAKLRDAVTAHKAKAGSVVVLDAITGEVLALANYPSYVPDKRQNLTGEQLRNRALTDTFEPGSTMKPITVAMALEAGRVKPQTLVETGPGRFSIGGFTISDTHNYGTLTVEGVIQKSSNVGALKIAQKMSPHEMWETYTALGYGRLSS